MFVFPIGNHRVLFVDDLYVGATRNLVKTLHQPRPHPKNPLLRGNSPWEKDYAVLHGTVLQDPCDGLFKAWYYGGHYAVSRDGIHWEKPLFNFYPYEGKPTNIVYQGFDPALLEKGYFNLDNISVMVFPEERDSEKRYKLFTFQAPLGPGKNAGYGLENYGYYTAFSADGIHWTGSSKPVLNRLDDPNMSDCHTCMYDPLKNRFIAFTKQHLFRPDGIGDQGPTQRVRGISFSDDFEHWTKPQTCLVPDDHDERSVNFYNMSGFVYEGMYLGLLEIYYSSDDHPTQARRREIQLISSRDGEHWWRAGGRKPFLCPSGCPGQWDAFMLDINSAGPILRPEEMWFYYGGRARHHVPHNTLFPEDKIFAAIGLATLRRDGFVSYDAGPEEGFLTTKPIRFDRGLRLHINAEIRGQITAEILMVKEGEAVRTEPSWSIVTGEPMPGFTRGDCRPVSGDCLDATIGWKGGDIGQMTGQLIALRLYLSEASLYSFWVE